jgi:hypothetical protein
MPWPGFEPGCLAALPPQSGGTRALGVFTFAGGDQCMVAMNFYLYGDQAAETVARVTPPWHAWIQERFPMPTALSKSE